MSTAAIEQLVNQPYKHGFVTDIESDTAAKGLSEDTIRFISAKKSEPEWLLEFRLKAYRHWLSMPVPAWANVRYPQIDFQNISYYSAPKAKKFPASTSATSIPSPTDSTPFSAASKKSPSSNSTT